MKNNTGIIQKMKRLRGQTGFTLVELMIAVFIGLIALGSLYGVFIIENDSFNLQDQIAEMQQNVRSGIDIMAKDIRMAGYDPVGSAGSNIMSITSNSIYFTMDLDEDGSLTSSGEHIAYDFYSNTLGRTVGSSANVNNSSVAPFHQPVAENIESVAFSYNSGTNEVTITLTGRTRDIDPDYTHPVFGDHYRRYTLETKVIPRNIGL